MAITISGSGITSANILDGTIVNADINSSAAIAGSKLTGTGKVLQVVSATYATQVSNTTNTYADTGLTATITPTSTTSKILVITSETLDSSNTAANSRGDSTLLRGSTAIAEKFFGIYDAGSSNVNLFSYMSFVSLDSPATTAATTYKTQIRCSGAAQVDANYRGSSEITLMEIGV